MTTAVNGGWSKEAPVIDEVEDICIKAGKQAGVNFDVCIPETFMQKTGPGKNYLVKVRVSGDKHLHVMVSRAGGGLTVIGVKYPKLHTDPLDPKEF